MTIKYFTRYCKIIIKRYHKFILAFLGLIMFSAYFWMRFLRLRTIKDLPLHLSIEGFFILLYVVIIFAFIIISLLFIKNSNPILEKVIDILFIPIKELDKGIKNISFVKRNYERILTYIFPLLEFLINKTDLFFVIFWILPRIILLSVLGMDIFLFSKFEYRYKFLFIGILLLFNRCFKYSLKNTKISLLNETQPYVNSINTNYYPWVHPSELEPDYDPDDEDNDIWPETMALPLDIFIKHQADYIVYKKITNDMSIIHSYYAYDYFEIKYLGHRMPDRRKMSANERVTYRTKYGNYNETYIFICNKREEFIDPKVHFILRIAVLLEYYNKTSNQTKKYQYLKVIIFSGYFICWLYVLVISYPHISMEEWNRLILYLEKYKEILNQIW